ncbi:MAG: hypothetical protein ACLUW6_02050 [Coriobacteriaceae bacterium]
MEAFAVLSGAPSVASGLTYNGDPQTGVAVPDTGKYVVSGAPQATMPAPIRRRWRLLRGYAWDETGNRESAAISGA